MESLLFATGLASFGVGAAMTLFAWSIVRQNRRREAARLELLAGRAFPEGMPVAVASPTAVNAEPGSEEFLSERTTLLDTLFREPVKSREFSSERTTALDTLFREPVKSGATSRRTLAVAAVCGVMTIGIGTYKWFSAASAPADPKPAASAAPEPARRPGPRVELLALDHTATPAGLLVTGRLRNPIDGASLHDVVAVVDVLDGTGRVLTTARAPIGRAVLNAGEWSDFSVAASKTSSVARYRVEFHAREREPVLQIDRRQTEPGPRSE